MPHVTRCLLCRSPLIARLELNEETLIDCSACGALVLVTFTPSDPRMTGRIELMRDPIQKVTVPRRERARKGRRRVD